jgi:hypothetical protein
MPARTRSAAAKAHSQASSPLRSFIEGTVARAVVAAVRDIEHRIEARVGDLVDRRLRVELGGGAAPKLSFAPARKARSAAPRKRFRGEMTRWVADKRARRVPLFVIEATGLDTKKKIVKRFGENASFEKGKPLPKAR